MAAVTKSPALPPGIPPAAARRGGRPVRARDFLFHGPDETKEKSEKDMRTALWRCRSSQRKKRSIKAESGTGRTKRHGESADGCAGTDGYSPLERRIRTSAPTLAEHTALPLVGDSPARLLDASGYVKSGYGRTTRCACAGLVETGEDVRRCKPPFECYLGRLDDRREIFRRRRGVATSGAGGFKEADGGR